MKVQDCVALVSGGNRGIGEAFVRQLLAAGAKRVYLGSRDPNNALELASELGDRVTVVQLDVADSAQIETVSNAHPEVNLVVNNAGVFRSQSLLKAADMDAMREEMEVNCFAIVAMTRAFAPNMEQQGSGAFINVLSAGALVAVPEMGGYSPSKFAARAASNCLRAELAPKNIGVTSLIVGSVKTRMAEHVKGIVQAQPDDIAKAGIAALEAGIDEHDTDPHAIGIRAALARDPSGLAKLLAAGVGAAK